MRCRDLSLLARQVVRCVVNGLRNLSFFPQPEGGTASVKFPILLGSCD